jgi:glycosyltransferase involved in cell wall biosynthesis
MKHERLLSIIIPCFNEEGVLREMHHRVSVICQRLDDLDHEIIYVDDGSRDCTPEILEAIQYMDPRVRVVGLSRNFGHQIAVTAGLEHAVGDAAVLIDADLQDPPELIPEMVAKWREGYDVVYAERLSREGETRFKLATARAFYRIMNRLAETRIPLDTGDFRLIDRRVVDALKSMPEHYRFVRGLVSWAGFRQIAIPYHRVSRYAGESKYPLAKMLRFAFDGITSFSVVPLRVVTVVGFFASLLATAGIIYALALRLFTSNWVTGWTALFIGFLLIGGVQLLSLGIIGEYVGRIYGEAKRRPLYLVRERLGFEPRPAWPRERVEELAEQPPESALRLHRS